MDPLLSLAEIFDKHFCNLDALQQQLVQSPEPSGGSLIRTLVEPWLMDPSSAVVGAGYIGRNEHGMDFDWWLAPMQDNPLFAASEQITRLHLEQREYADYVRDYYQLEWFKGPQDSGQRHITGPFVDHLCICDYVLTLTVPATASTSGVLGLDLQVRDMEPEIQRLLAKFDGEAALVSHQGRVITSTDPLHGLGEIIAVDSTAQSLQVPGTSLRVVTKIFNPSK
ncbi:hypothetical protein [Glutamicibacter sp.]|uniref:hypothetical protein n=1 Tax=Glutamicibacter sp. TaxID=1931995 RepID=UPI0028BE42CA|nr:hypothetical protein [Glutamicibacter sp.]